ncbi:MAG: hypothetical protein QOE95_1418 [Gaiellaceae bacterium]|nr:hypothetical protein [Gaiellaceae bacterium]
MVRFACVAVAALTLAGGAAATAPVPRITQTSIAGTKLGLARGAYRKPFGGAPKVAQLEDGLTRLDFPRSASVFFRSSGGGAIGIVVWGEQYRTAARIGPCSTAAQLKRAYGPRLKPFRLQGKVVGYRLDRLFFAVENGKRVGVVQLSSPALPPYAALNSLSC